jgi:hypothetical protein
LRSASASRRLVARIGPGGVGERPHPRSPDTCRAVQGQRRPPSPHPQTAHYDEALILLEPNEATQPLARQRVTVINYPDGRFAIRHKGLDLPFRVFDKLRKINQAAIVENKRLGAVLAHIRERQDAYEPA